MRVKIITGGFRTTRRTAVLKRGFNEPMQDFLGRIGNEIIYLTPSVTEYVETVNDDERNR